MLLISPRQDSCLLLMIPNLGVIRMRDGTVWGRFQEQSGGAVVAAGERRYWHGIKRGWGFGADIGAVTNNKQDAYVESLL